MFLQLPLAVLAQPLPNMKVGVIADVHYADLPPKGNRHYRAGLARLKEAVTVFHQERAAFAVELGDFIDEAPDVAGELAHLKAIRAVFEEFPGDRRYVLGNHCVWTLTKKEFLAGCGVSSSFYSFRTGGVHFVVLDSCFRRDGAPYGRKNFDWRDTTIPANQLEWLQQELAAAQPPVIVFLHHRLDEAGEHSVESRQQVRAALEASGKVLAVFQGHSHANVHSVINGIHYATLAASVDGPDPDGGAYAIIQFDPSGALILSGYRRMESRRLPVGVPAKG